LPEHNFLPFLKGLKVMRNEYFEISLGRTGKCWSQPAKVDIMCPKMGAGGKKRIL
jgi:hypothetical protein